MVSATICACTVFEPLPMSEVPANTSMRPSGLTLIQAWDGSPFWFMPVGYSMAENPRPLWTAISVLRGRGLADEVRGQQIARAQVGGHRPVGRGQLVAHGIGH